MENGFPLLIPILCIIAVYIALLAYAAWRNRMLRRQIVTSCDEIVTRWNEARGGAR